MATETTEGIYIDGAVYTNDDLTYREQRQVRVFIQELAPDGDVDEAGEADVVPAFVCVVKRRAEPAFTLEQALDLKPTDLVAPPTKAPRKR